MFRVTFACNDFLAPSFKIVRVILHWLLRLVDFLANGQFTKTEELSDKDLVSRMQKGDDHAFELLYHRYFDQLYGYIIRRVGHAQIAEDIFADLFMKAFASRQRFVWKTSFSAWIYRIAMNAITDHHRTKKKSEPIETAEYATMNSVIPEGLDNEILNRELEKLLELLKERERLVISLKFYSQMNNSEIAEVLGCSVNNVGVILFRALKQCKKKSPEILQKMM